MRLRLASPTAPTRYIELGPAHGESHPGRYATVNAALIGEMLPTMTIGGNVIGHGVRETAEDAAARHQRRKFSIHRENRT